MTSFLLDIYTRKASLSHIGHIKIQIRNVDIMKKLFSNQESSLKQALLHYYNCIWHPYNFIKRLFSSCSTFSTCCYSLGRMQDKRDTMHLFKKTLTHLCLHCIDKEEEEKKNQIYLRWQNN